MKKLCFVIMFLFFIGCAGYQGSQLETFTPKGEDIRVKYIKLLVGGGYMEAYSLLSERVRKELGSVEDFCDSNERADALYKKHGVSEKIITDSIKVKGNIVTYRTKVKNPGGTIETWEGRSYMAIVDKKIDWISNLGEPMIVSKESGI